MPLPQLNTQGSDITNTLLKIYQLKQGQAAMEHYNKQNALLDYKMSPEVRDLEKREAEAKIKNYESEGTARSALVNRQNVDTARDAHALIRNIISNVDVDTMGGEDYTKAYGYLKTKYPEYSVTLPDPKIFEKDDVRSSTGKTFDSKMFKNWQMKVRKTAEDWVKEGKPEMENKIIYFTFPDGSTDEVIQPVKKGEVFDIGKEWGPYASTKAPKEVKTTGKPVYLISDPKQTGYMSVSEDEDVKPWPGWAFGTPPQESQQMYQDEKGFMRTAKDIKDKKGKVTAENTGTVTHIGDTEDGKPLLLNSKDGKISVGVLPGGGKMVPKGGTKKEITPVQAVSLEEKILQNPGSEAAAPSVDLFHKSEDKPYAYVKTNVTGLKSYLPGTDEFKWEKVPLPVKNGVQITTKMIRENAAKKGVSFETILNQVLEAAAKQKQ